MSSPSSAAPRRIALRRTLAILIPVAMFLSLVSWAFASPVGASPDDDFHLASIWCGQGIREGLCEPGDHADERRIPAVLLDAPTCFAFHPDQSASCPLPPSSTLVDTKRGNFTGVYPPVFYGTMSIFASSNIDVSVLLMRIFNALLFVGFGTALFLLLPRARRTALVWPMIITSVPLGMFLIPSVNPSSWALLSASGLWLATVGFLEAESAAKRIALGAIAAALTVIGSGARSDAAVYAGIAVVVAVILTARRTRAWALTAVLPIVLVVVAVAFFLASSQSGVVDPGSAQAVSGGGSKLNLLAINLITLPSLWAGVFGTWGLGWLDTILPPTVWFPTIVTFSGVVFMNLRRMVARKAIAVGLVFASLVAIPLYILVHDDVIVGSGVQPRYIYPLIIMLAGVCLWGVRRADLFLSRTQLGAIVVLLTIANAVALHTNLRRYVTGANVKSVSLDNTQWWWSLPFGPNVVWIVGSLVFGVGLLLWVMLSRRTAAPARDAIALGEPQPS